MHQTRNDSNFIVSKKLKFFRRYALKKTLLLLVVSHWYSDRENKSVRSTDYLRMTQDG